MIENEIIKALECCSSRKNCEENYPYFELKRNFFECVQVSTSDAIDCIRRHQTEIERLNGWVNSLEELCETKTALLTDANWSLTTARVEAIKEFEEKLKYRVKDISFNTTIINDFCTYIDDIVKEIIKKVTK